MAEKKDDLVMVRVLMDCEHGKCNSVAQVPRSALKSLAGVVDDSPEAVEYALSQEQ